MQAFLLVHSGKEKRSVKEKGSAPDVSGITAAYGIITWRGYIWKSNKYPGAAGGRIAYYITSAGL